MTIHIDRDIEQGSVEWLAARCGLLTASEIHLIITPTLKIASNDKERSHLYELAAQRITQYVEPHIQTMDMQRGHVDEADALDVYNRHYARVTLAGFITNDRWGFTIGYSPDGLVGDDGLIEVKSRKQKYQVRAILEYGTKDAPDPDFNLQVQTGLLVSERKWCDLISYCGGMPMLVVRVLPDPVIQAAIVDAATAFEARLAEKIEAYNSAVNGLVMTERRKEEEMF